MALSPPQRPSTAQQTDNQYAKEIIDEFLLLKNQYEQSKEIQHELVVNYHQTILKVIASLQQDNQAHQEQIEQFQSEILNHIQDNETFKMRYDLSEQSKYSTLQTDFDSSCRASDIETCQIVKALQSDHQFEFEKLRSEHQEIINQMKSDQEKTQIITTATDVQTVERETLDKQTNQQTQFNLAIQRAIQNATQPQKNQILQLEQQLADKQNKIIKLKECVKKLQNFYTLSSTPPPILPSVDRSLITSSMDDEQSITTNETTTTKPLPY